VRLRKPAASEVVLGLLCLMYLITYFDRTNVATAASEIRKELKLTNTQWGLIASAFGYPYILFQVFGGWVGDRFGPRWTLFACGLVWASATMLTGLAGGFMSLFMIRVMLGFGEGATFPVATRAMQAWTPPDRRGFAQGLTHAFSRFGNAITPPIVAFLVVAVSWRGSFVLIGVLSLVWGIAWVVYFRDVPVMHPAITEAELEQLPRRGAAPVSRDLEVPWKRLALRMLPVTVVYFCYGWTLWLYLNWLPQFFLQEYKVNIMSSATLSSAVFAAGVVGDYLGGLISDRILRRTGDLVKARRNVVIVGFLSSAVFLVPVFLTRDLTVIVISLSGAFMCAELVIGPMWAVPMDIAPKYSGTASGFMNTGSALAAVLSPMAFGYLADLTGNWHLPFLGSLGLLLLGAALAFSMHPERMFEEQPMAVPDKRLAHGVQLQ
jgi:MFS family permease